MINNQLSKEREKYYKYWKNKHQQTIRKPKKIMRIKNRINKKKERRIMINLMTNKS